jgi:hypothetical protein
MNVISCDSFAFHLIHRGLGRLGQRNCDGQALNVNECPQTFVAANGRPKLRHRGGATKDLGFGPLNTYDPPPTRFGSCIFLSVACFSDLYPHLCAQESKPYSTRTHIYKGTKQLSAHMYPTYNTRPRVLGPDKSFLHGAGHSDSLPASEVDLSYQFA